MAGKEILENSKTLGMNTEKLDLNAENGCRYEYNKDGLA